MYYDIDDLIFDYERISYLHFLTGSEYKDFKKTTEQIHSCMELCDGYFTSTDTLAGEIRREFPGKTSGNQPELCKHGDADSVP